MMRPALQRLLSRPTSLDLLRHLVGSLEIEGCPISARRLKCTTRNTSRRHGYASLASGAWEMDNAQLDEDQQIPTRTNTGRPTSYSTGSSSIHISLHEHSPRELTHHAARKTGISHTIYGGWGTLLTHEQLEFESDLDGQDVGSKKRLLDMECYKNDMALWGALFHHRKRIYQDDGVLTFLNALTRRGVSIPTNGILANTFWLAFLDLGLRNPPILNRVFQYTEYIWKTERRFWSKLYSHIVRFFLSNGRSKDAVLWHERLIQNHAPGPKAFAEMCRQVVFQGGDTEALREIYLKNNHRNVYAKIVPLLCQREEFKAALDWHYFFLQNGDLPSSSKIVEPLIHYLAVYEPKHAPGVTRGLVAAGVSFASGLSKELKDNTKISREMMNLIHGETLNISAKKYNDNLGARWFATRWISVDIAINGVHALGVDEIGPLSLQAIALRDSDPQSVTRRIMQLRFLGISIGPSLYSRAIEEFARIGNREHLEGLLNSDQHPDVFEDRKVQEELLLSFARARDWKQYERTLKIQSLASRSPSIEQSNLELRTLITLGDQEGIKVTLERMHDEKCPVKSRTIAYLIRHTLRPRRRGHRPMFIPSQTNIGRHNDLNVCIKLLKQIMESGSFVPVMHWREIIRRLGMMGRFKDLRALVLFLTTWYSPQKRFPLSRPRYYHVPSQVATNHPLHPLKILFNTSFQRAVVEWGFIAKLRPKPGVMDPRQRLLPRPESPLPNLAWGIRLLKLLHQRGVHVNGPSVRRAIISRLIIYYGPGRSNRRHNRYGQQLLWGHLGTVAKQIDEALGADYLSQLDLQGVVENIAKRRLAGIQRRKARLLKKTPVQALSIGGDSSEVW